MRSERTARGLALLAATALLAAACGGNGDGDGGQPTGGAERTGTRVEVTENEFTIALPEKQFTPGTYTFVVKNDGATGHDLAIAGPGVSDAKTPLIRSGQTESVTVTLREGSYELWCTIGNHREQGMELTLSVGGAASPTSPAGGEDGGY